MRGRSDGKPQMKTLGIGLARVTSTWSISACHVHRRPKPRDSRRCCGYARLCDGRLARVGSDYWAAENFRVQHKVPLNYSAEDLEKSAKERNRTARGNRLVLAHPRPKNTCSIVFPACTTLSTAWGLIAIQQPAYSTVQSPEENIDGVVFNSRRCTLNVGWFGRSTAAVGCYS